MDADTRVAGFTDDRQTVEAPFAPPQVSVVINTLNRASIIERSIESLRYQDYENFELIVINGPSTDDTDAILDRLGDAVKVGRIAEANLSKSRNAGIALASGEIVLFLDDDAFAEPGWITNIVRAYEDPRVAAVGTRVWDHLGFHEQVNPRLIDEHYNPILDATTPTWAFDYADSRTIPHILGASSSFRRNVLQQIGGFDEEIEYFLDESEVCRRIAQAGYLIRLLEQGPAVHHKYSPGVVRDERKLLTHPYPVVKNKFYVTLADARRSGRSVEKALTMCADFADGLLQGAQGQLQARQISPKEFARFREEVTRGVTDGRSRGLYGERKRVELGTSPLSFRPFARLLPEGEVRSFCFICRYLPQSSPGGVAKFMLDLAKGFAARGHVVTVIAEAIGPAEITFVDGVWIRKLSMADAPLDCEISANFESGAAQENFAWSAMAHAEVQRVQRCSPVDLVITPVWNTEGLHCALDRTLRTVVTLQTTFKTFAEIEWRKLDASTAEELLILERMLVENAGYVHAISDAIRVDVRDSYRSNRSSRWVTAHLGVDDLAEGASAKRADADERDDAPIRVTYVSRLEKRKGTDVFLAAAMKLVAAHDDVVVELVGRDVTADDQFEGYASLLAGLSPMLRKRIVFRGEVDDAELLRAYRDCDIFCVPSRFESFGLIYLEAMRAAKPVVACAVGGVPELVEDGVTGILVAPDSVAGLSAALERLVRDPALRAAMGVAGRQRFEDRFTADKMVERTLTAYEAMIDG